MARRPAVLATAWEAERVKADMVFVLRGSRCGATSRSGADWITERDIRAMVWTTFWRGR